MTCPLCNVLRSAWYATATPCDSQRPEIIVKVRDADRMRPEYQAALNDYKDHKKECVRSE